MTKEQKTAKAYALYEGIRNDIRTQSFIYLQLGEKLKEIRDGQLYLYISEGGFDTFQDFLNNPEIGIRPSTAYAYIGIYEFYKLKLGMTNEEITDVPMNRLLRLKPQLAEKGNEEAKEIVQDMGVMTNYDFDIESQERGFRVVDKPVVYLDKNTNRWVIEFHPDKTEKIIDTESKLVIYHNI